MPPWRALAVLGVGALLSEPRPVEWTRWAGVAERCPLWVAHDPARLPAPRWAPCLGVPGCRELVIDWPHGPGSPMSVTPSMEVDDGGRAILSYTQLGSAVRQWLVARVDGPVLAALRQPRPSDPGCTLTESGVNEGVAAWVARGDGSGAVRQSNVDALVLLGVADPTPRIVGRDDSAEVSSWIAGRSRLVRAVAPERRGELYDAAGRFLRILHEPTSDGLPFAGNPARLRGDDVFFEVGNAEQRAIRVAGADGAVALLRRDAGNLGTDGHDLVWSEISAGETVVMTARYATDAAALRARRVAPDPNPVIGAAPFVVGCGRAAHAVPGGVAVAQLTAGAERIDPLPAPPPGSRWGRPLALTCDELFVLTFTGGAAGIARLPLAAI